MFSTSFHLCTYGSVWRMKSFIWYRPDRWRTVDCTFWAICITEWGNAQLYILSISLSQRVSLFATSSTSFSPLQMIPPIRPSAVARISLKRRYLWRPSHHSGTSSPPWAPAPPQPQEAFAKSCHPDVYNACLQNDPLALKHLRLHQNLYDKKGIKKVDATTS